MPVTLVAILGLVSASAIGCVCAMAGQLYERRKWEKRLVEQAGLRVIEAVPDLPRARINSDDRLERLEQSVEAIALEMERVGEGQRFVTKLLSERRPERTPSPVPGSVKPPFRITPS